MNNACHICFKVKKALELYEQLRQRMGVVVVGPSGSGKSTLWTTLRLAMEKSGHTVKHYTMNPKAMPRTQLLGQIDIDTREWTDGVLTNSARQVVKEPQGWLATWTEYSLNNDLLCYLIMTIKLGIKLKGNLMIDVPIKLIIVMKL